MSFVAIPKLLFPFASNHFLFVSSHLLCSLVFESLRPFFIALSLSFHRLTLETICDASTKLNTSAMSPWFFSRALKLLNNSANCFVPIYRLSVKNRCDLSSFLAEKSHKKNFSCIISLCNPYLYKKGPLRGLHNFLKYMVCSSFR